MGTDIHLVLELKINGEWVGIEEDRSHTDWVKGPVDKWERKVNYRRASSRNYDTFAKLAGVRGDGPGPKGLPDDASQLVRAIYPEDDSDLHSHSWCTLQEFFEVKLATMYDAPEALLLGEHPAVTYPMAYWFGMYEPEKGEEYRVVFCFSN